MECFKKNGINCTKRYDRKVVEMNAYELADFIDKYCEDNTSKEAAVLLRQQADRITELEKDLHMIQRHYDQLDTQTKPLSDEEILNVAFCCEVNTVAIENDWDGTVIDFARAILKKASEK